ncbi:hypothetical protein [Microbacterium sp. CFBP 8794]|uniref:hypothetical protein n=1 Tax=Microbacterium sp. CFBP 8794 TaxID=2775269 RepID=UPI00178316E1|nr:hypothetical protein [Microbacterium sp. CFBP 8794]MBD8478950.1 hypothetical protein [Microbacterium sp. CFBP 8794]
MTLEQVWAEYKDAIARFPLALPSGWSFPADSALRSAVPDASWEVGSGESEAYLVWQEAVAFAANEAQSRGDLDEADRMLSLLEAGYSSNTRKRALEDPNQIIMTDALDAARDDERGADYESLLQAVAAG